MAELQAADNADFCCGRTVTSNSFDTCVRKMSYSNLRSLQFLILYPLCYTSADVSLFAFHYFRCKSCIDTANRSLGCLLAAGTNPLEVMPLYGNMHCIYCIL